MRFRRRPVGAVGLVMAVGKLDFDRQSALPDERRFDPNRDRIAGRMNAGLHPNRFAIETKLAGHQPRPQFQLLLDILDVFQSCGRAIALAQLEAQAAQIEAMRVLA